MCEMGLFFKLFLLSYQHTKNQTCLSIKRLTVLNAAFLHGVVVDECYTLICDLIVLLAIFTKTI